MTAAAMLAFILAYIWWLWPMDGHSSGMDVLKGFGVGIVAYLLVVWLCSKLKWWVQ